MRKLFLVLMAALLLGGMTVQAAPVSADRALEVAKKALAKPATKASGDLKLIWNGEDAATKAATQPAFYVFGRDGGGFVIVAGDDNVQPVLAISETNRFEVEGMPENVKWWMDYIKGYVRSVSSQSSEVAQQWAALTETKAAIDESLIENINTDSATVPWNQNAPANGLAPKVNANQSQAIAGCVPVAVAEILTWHKWPNAGVGLTDAYQSRMYNDDGTLAGYYAIQAYSLDNPEHSNYLNINITDANWDDLQALNTYDAFQNCTDPVRAQLSRLVFACGLLVHANFNDAAHGGTSASTNIVPAAFAAHMKYNKAAHIEYLADHTTRDWNSLLKTQVLQHPVLYSGEASVGSGNDVGHAYVLDGHATLKLGGDDVFHFNFGWGGSCNGYYYANYQATTNYTFNLELGALLDFVPDRTGTSSYIYKLEYDSHYIPGIILYNNPFSTDNYFQISIGVKNVGNKTYNGKLAAKLIGKTGVEKDVFDFYMSGGYNDAVTALDIGYYMQDYYRIKLHDPSTPIEFGDKIVLYCTSDEGQSSYEPIKGRIDGSVVSELPIMPAAFIKTAATYKVNDYFVFQIMNCDYAYDATVWTITKTGSVTPVVLNQSDKEYQFTETGTYKIEAAVAPNGGTVVETLVTYVEVH
ncbi:MAG: C10 family peptidase [Bacteroidales bacterium]|nr:C10 family peptidase [Bacteroidales bacterium]